MSGFIADPGPGDGARPATSAAALGKAAGLGWPRETTTRPLNIVHVIGRLAMVDGGPPRACLDMARALAARGHRVQILTTDGVSGGEQRPPLDGPVEHHGAAIRYFPLQAPRFWLRSSAMAQALAQAVPQADLVVCHSLYRWHSRFVPALCRAVGVPYVVRPHGTLDPYIRQRRRLAKWLLSAWFQSAALRDAAAIQYTTVEELRLAREVVGHDRAIVAPLGMFPEDIVGQAPPPALDTLFPEVRGRRVLAYLGRLHPKKGLELLLHALAGLTRDGVAVHALLCGPDNGSEQGLRSLADRLGVAGHVTFAGYTTGDRKRAVLAGGDLMVLPSHSENFGLAIAEALFHGMPVVVSDKVNLCREVDRYGAGWVCRTDPAALETALRAALGDPDERRRRGVAAERLAGDLYDWHRIGAHLEAAYRAVAAREPLPPPDMAPAG